MERTHYNAKIMLKRIRSIFTARRFHWFVILVLLGLWLLWLTLTPTGVSGKLNAIAYAVCQQDPTHTLALGGRLLPLCSRCTGMYLGALAALLFLVNPSRPKKFPSKGKMCILLLFFFVFIVDGANSLVAEIWPKWVLYTPSNNLRLATGLGMGMVIANLLLPMWNQIFWAEASDKPALHSWKQLLGILLLETGIGWAVLKGWGWLYFPVSILATGMVPILISMIYTLLWLVIIKKENMIKDWKEGWPYAGMGVILASIQIGLFDLMRFLLTGTWQGLHF
jgi:Predicted membrane protein